MNHKPNCISRYSIMISEGAHKEPEKKQLFNDVSMQDYTFISSTFAFK